MDNKVKMKVKVQAKLTKRDEKGDIIDETEFEEREIDNNQMVKELRKRGGK